jgi:hypothetical protein
MAGDAAPRKGPPPGGVSSTIYFLGFVGAAVYYIGHAASFGAGVVGLLKALVWPAFLVYQLMDFLHM